MNTLDPIAEGFFRAASRDILKLAAASGGILSVEPGPGDPPTIFIAHFQCDGLVRHSATGEIRRNNQWIVGLRFPSDYLRQVEPTMLTTLLHPAGTWQPWHPNMLGPFICLGHINPGTPACEIIWQLYEVITGNKAQTADCLNPAAAEFLRNNPDAFPVDRRPLAKSNAQTEGARA